MATDTRDTLAKRPSDRGILWSGAFFGAVASISNLCAKSPYTAWPFIFFVGTTSALIWFRRRRWRQPWFWATGAALIALDVGLIKVNLERPLPTHLALLAFTAFQSLSNVLLLFGVERMWLARTYPLWRAPKPILQGVTALVVAVAGFLPWWVEGF